MNSPFYITVNWILFLDVKGYNSVCVFFFRNINLLIIFSFYWTLIYDSYSTSQCFLYLVTNLKQGKSAKLIVHFFPTKSWSRTHTFLQTRVQMWIYAKCKSYKIYLLLYFLKYIAWRMIDILPSKICYKQDISWLFSPACTGWDIYQSSMTHTHSLY